MSSSSSSLTSLLHKHPRHPGVYLIEYPKFYQFYRTAGEYGNIISPAFTITGISHVIQLAPHRSNGNVEFNVQSQSANQFTLSIPKTQKSIMTLNLQSSNRNYNEYSYICNRNTMNNDCCFENDTMLVLITSPTSTTYNKEQMIDFINSVTGFYDDKNLLLGELQSSLNRNSLHDCTIKCTKNSKGGKKSIGVTKFMLVLRSPVFEAMFSSGMTESSSDTITIDDFDDKIVMKMVEFIYTDEFNPANYNEGTELFIIAHRYQITELKNLAERYLIRNTDLSGDNVLDMWKFASKFEIDAMKFKVLTFLTENLKQIVNVGNGPKMAQQIVEVLGPELILFQANIHPLQLGGSSNTAVATSST